MKTEIFFTIKNEKKQTILNGTLNIQKEDVKYFFNFIKEYFNSAKKRVIIKIYFFTNESRIIIYDNWHKLIKEQV